MSTFSWSYKNAPHQKPTVSQDTCQDDTTTTISTTSGTIAMTPSGLLATKQNVQTSSAKSNEDQTTTKPKRLNWKAKLYVGNLNKKTTEASLAYYFRVFGDLDDVKLIRDHDTNESRCFAFITFEKIESAEKAKKWCSFNYPTIDDNSIVVASAERKLPKIKPVPRNEYLAKRDPSQTLFWEYRWGNEQNAEVFGPYETSLMLAWKNQGYFDGGCWVRQVHRDVRRVIGKKEEICEVRPEQESEETPSKKLKLVVDYSDSDEEDEENAVNEIVKEEKDESERKIKCKTVGMKSVETTNENTEMNVRQDNERSEKAADVNEIVENILEMIVESVSKENEHKDLLKQYDEQNFTTRPDDEFLTLETRRRGTFSDSDDDDDDDDDDDGTDQKDMFSTEFVDISEIDFSFFP